MDRKLFYFASGLGIVLVLIFWPILFKGNSYNRPPAEGNIIFFGDSLVEGVGASPGNDLSSQISRMSGQTILNAGKSGDTTASAMSRLDRDILSKNPRLVIILLGGNDSLNQVPIDETFGNLSVIIDKIKLQKAAVLLLGIRGGLLDDPYGPRFKKLAKIKNIVYVPNVLSGIIGHADLMSDTVHPNDTGYAKIAEKITPVLKSILR